MYVGTPPFVSSVVTRPGAARVLLRFADGDGHWSAVKRLTHAGGISVCYLLVGDGVRIVPVWVAKSEVMLLVKISIGFFLCVLKTVLSVVV